MRSHALSLSHPGIRCRCLAAYGDAVSAVKWYLFTISVSQNENSLGSSTYFPYIYRATRLGREHHDDLAQFLLGMGYAAEALHLPGISKR